MRERQEEIDKALRDGGPFVVREGIERSRGRVQHARENVGQAARCDHAWFAQSGLAGNPSVQRLARDRQHDGAHVALKHHAPLGVSRQQEKMAGRNDAVPGAAFQHHAIFDRQQRNRQILVRLRQWRDRLRSRRHPAQCHAGRIAMRRRRVAIIEGTARGGRLQADRVQHVPPCLGAVVLRVGLTGERMETHRSTWHGITEATPVPDKQNRAPRRRRQNDAHILHQQLKAGPIQSINRT
jgi:hypothetical protein